MPPHLCGRRPALQALRRSAHAMEALLLTVRAEVPDTAATLRLSGMELADCIQEVGALRCARPGPGSSAEPVGWDSRLL